MINQVKRRLVIYNAVVLAVVFLFFFGGTWLMLQRGFLLQSERFLMQLAISGQKEIPPVPAQEPGLPLPIADSNRAPGPMPEARDERAMFHFSEKGELLQFTTSREMTETLQGELLALAKSIPNDDPRGTIRASAGWYRYFSRFDENGGKTIAFVDISREKAVFSTLLQVYLVIGAAGLVLVVLSSLFLTNQALIPIRQAWEKQVRFVGDASHELRTPLTVISTNLDVISENRKETVESQLHWLSNIRRAYRRMDSLVSDLLFLAQADAERPMTEQRAFSLSNAAIESALQFEAAALQRSMNLERQIQDDIRMVGDDRRIRQLIAILLDNAFKYTPDKGTVSMMISADPSFAVIRVSDNGIGIPHKDRKRIFERFYRVDQARSRETGGNGMGLSIASCIVQEHRGSINVENNSCAGSIFSVTLPLRIGHTGFPGSRNIRSRETRAQLPDS